ncbi:hypothetical protein RBA41_21755 [Massilia sp. CCM 9210]|uniref:hypothetical protein n=1 Tax=Massilia scottii TaxID=3057166 RepID=UPI002796D5F7|nr:hypothetical protein [Massilia sp. CCM 9210]MDQ1815926.1 hypothetical protein [Massilia sp. CCM 9210]
MTLLFKKLRFTKARLGWLPKRSTGTTLPLRFAHEQQCKRRRDIWSGVLSGKDGLSIVLAEWPGLRRKTRQAVPTAIRRCLDRHPEIFYAILDAHDLLVPD